MSSLTLFDVALLALGIFTVVAMVWVIVRGPVYLLSSIRRGRATDKWLDARHKLNEFLEAWPDIKHPEAQRLLEEEIAAYEEWMRTHSYCTDTEKNLLFLQSLLVKKKSLLRSIR